MTSALEKLGEFVAAYRPDERVRAKVRLHVTDTIGAWIAATGTEEGRALLRMRRDDDRLIDHVSVNCAVARLSEVDDIHLAAMITPGAIVIPAALACAAKMNNEGSDELVAAIVAGYEAMVRLGVAIEGPSVLYRGIWPTYFAAPFGVAAMYARLTRLDARKTAYALAQALITASPGVGHHAAATTSRWLAIGRAAARGLEAATAAAAGFSADVAIADGDFFKSIYGIAPDSSVLRDGLGELALDQVSFKPWCAARQTMAATQGLREILREGVAATDISAIEVSVLPPHLKMINHGVAAGDRFSHLTSVQYQMALAALDPEGSYRLTPPAAGISRALLDFMARISVRGDESLLAAGYPKAWVARIAVVTPAGRRERSVDRVPGDPGRPFGDDYLERKFSRIVGPVVGQPIAEDIFSRSLGAIDQPAGVFSVLQKLSIG